MSVQPPRGAGRIRLLKIPDIDLQPCGGTHVANIAEIGGIQVLRIRNEGKRNKRVEIPRLNQSRDQRTRPGLAPDLSTRAAGLRAGRAAAAQRGSARETGSTSQVSPRAQSAAPPRAGRPARGRRRRRRCVLVHAGVATMDSARARLASSRARGVSVLLFHPGERLEHFCGRLDLVGAEARRVHRADGILEPRPRAHGLSAITNAQPMACRSR